MPLQQTSGAASYDAFGGGAPVAAKYIEDFFQTWLRTGTGSSTTVTTGLNASINKSLVWTKSRSAATNHKLTDTARGVTKALSSNTTGAEVTDSQGLTAFSSTGYTIGTNTDYNNSGATYVDWQGVATPKFFDVVTYTGNGSAPRDIAHSLGSSPGCIIIKKTSSTGDWWVWHRATPNANANLYLNNTDAADTGANPMISGVSSTTFTLATNQNATMNASGATYVAYLFAHNAGGFGLTGTDNVISCGSVVGSSQVEVNLGYEPQWILVKNASAAQDWWLVDNMRGLPVQDTGNAYNASNLRPNLSDAETTGFSIAPSATGFKANVLTSGQTYIYIAIRRGPMKVPTTGTSVYNAVARTGTGATANVTGVGFSPDLLLSFDRTNAFGSLYPWRNRLAGKTQRLSSASSAAEVTEGSDALTAFTMDGISVGGDATNTANLNTSGVTYIQHFFKRAPSFFDVVCYTGTGSAQNLAHNLAVVPELMIVKRRTSGTGDFWFVYSASTGNTIYLSLNTTSAVEIFSGIWNDTTPTSTQFTIGYYISQSAAPYVAYLFATCAGVSKVGSYTGTGTTKQIDCGFTGGARFVLIKRTDSTGDWYVWDTARGIVAGNDPYLLLNSTAAEVTNTDYVDTYSAGFEISSTAPAAINANGGTFIFLAIA